MFTLNHFIWLGIICVYVLALLFVTKRFRISFQNILYYMSAISIGSELLKTFVNMIASPDGGLHLDPGDLPLHLCSIQIFFIFYLTLSKNEPVKRVLKLFMFPTMMIGAVLALLIPTVGVRFSNPQVWQYFIFHGSLIFFAVYMLKEGMIDMKGRDFGRNYALLAILAMCGIWVNSILSVYDTNFLYLTRPPMDNLPILNLDNGWFCYFLIFINIAVLLVALVQLPIYFYYRRKSKTGGGI